jgi:hypothetical protein
MSKGLTSTTAPTHHSSVTEREAPPLLRQNRSSAAEYRHLIIFTCAVLVAMWLVCLALLYLVIAGVQWIYRAISAH